MSKSLFRNYLGFFTNQEIAVNVYKEENSEKSYKAKISLNRNSYASLELERIEDAIALMDTTELYCKESGNYYFLGDCEFSGFSFFPKFIIKSENRFIKTFLGVRVLFRGLSEWMIGNKAIEPDGNGFRFKKENRIFDASPGKLFQVSNEYWFSSTDSSRANINYKEYCILKIESLSEEWSANQVKEKIRDLKRIFSLLSGQKLFIEYAIGFSNNESNSSIYFLDSQFEEDINFNEREIFFEPNYLFKFKKFEPAINSYFLQNKYKFDDIWSRLIGMIGYSGYWEFRILGFVALLDKLVTHHADGTNKRIITKSKFSDIKSKLKNIIFNYDLDKSGALGVQHQELYRELARKLDDGFVNEHLSTFKEKFESLSKEMDPEVKQVINFSEDNFKHLKSIRDAIAHGKSPTTKISGDITAENAIANKVILMLLYFAYKDLSLTDDDFLQMISSSMSKIPRGAYINHTALDYRLKNTIRLDVDDTQFSRIENAGNKHCVLKYCKTTGKYKLLSKMTEALESGFYNFSSRNSNVRSVMNRPGFVGG